MNVITRLLIIAGADIVSWSRLVLTRIVQVVLLCWISSANAVLVDFDSATYRLSTISGTFNQLEGRLVDQPWYGNNSSLNINERLDIGSSLGDSLGYYNFGDRRGPYFAYLNAFPSEEGAIVAWWDRASGSFLSGGVSKRERNTYVVGKKVNNLGASVISSFRNYVDGAKNTDKTYQERLNECAALGPDCDFDATRNDQEFRQNLENAKDATFASKDLVTKTSILPQNELELVAEAPGLLGEIKAFFQWIGLLPEDENRDEIINAGVEGESGQFTVNPTFDSYVLTYVFDFDSESFLSDLVGESFLFNKSLGGGDYYAGYGVVESVEALDTGIKRATLSISQLESNNAIPTAGTFWLLLLGMALGRAGRAWTQ